MQQQFTYPRSQYDETRLDREIIYKLIIKHAAHAQKLKRLKDYYLGQHDIYNRKRKHSGTPNPHPVANHAYDIATTASGYFMGNAVRYTNTNDKSLEELLLAFDVAEVDDTDSDNALNMSIFGVAYEYVYAKPNEAELSVKSLDPANTFIVVDDTIAETPLFTVYYYESKDDVENTTTYHATVMTQNLIYQIKLRDDSQGYTNGMVESQPHLMGDIPVIEYRNNKYCVGDFEQQLGLIDAYNNLAADRVADKEKAIEAILVLYNASLADDEEQAREALGLLQKEGFLELPADARLEYVTNTLDENSIEVLRKALKEDIYTFSHVPNLTDVNFASNTSGVAMEFKLLGLEMLTKTKERYYVRGLRKRIRLFAEYYGMKEILNDANSIVPTFTRGLPKNLLELSQIIANLDGKISTRSLIKLLPFVEDPDAELDEVKKQKEEAVQAFNFGSANTAPEEVTDEQDG